MPETGFTQSFLEAALVINNRYMRGPLMMYINVMKSNKWNGNTCAVDNSNYVWKTVTANVALKLNNCGEFDPPG